MAEKVKKESCEDLKEETPAAESQNDSCEQERAQNAEFESLKAELAEKNDLCLRIAAEYDNFRKRSGKEKEQIFGDAYSCAINAFLPVFDNLERAILFPEGDGMKKGIDLIIKQLFEIMEKQNIKQINPVGERFNPELHNAVMHIEDESLGESIVAEVLQKGYMIGDRVIRHAMVKVAN
jgi:molecular chaperone GrpE